jgi:hypothetical protein
MEISGTDEKNSTLRVVQSCPLERSDGAVFFSFCNQSGCQCCTAPFVSMSELSSAKRIEECERSHKPYQYGRLESQPSPFAQHPPQSSLSYSGDETLCVSRRLLLLSREKWVSKDGERSIVAPHLKRSGNNCASESTTTGPMPLPFAVTKVSFS